MIKATIHRKCPACEYKDKKSGTVSSTVLDWMKQTPVVKAQQCPACKSWGMEITVTKEKPIIRKPGEQDYISGAKPLNDIWKLNNNK